MVLAALPARVTPEAQPLGLVGGVVERTPGRMLQNLFFSLFFLKKFFFSSLVPFSITCSGQNPLVRLWDTFKMSSRNDNLSLFQHGNVVSPDVSNVPNRDFQRLNVASRLPA